MRFVRKNNGFTLIELLIVILTGTIVTAAATTILLLAMRINRKSLDTIEHQSIMRIMDTVVEDMGSNSDFVLGYNAIQDEHGVISPYIPTGSTEAQKFWSISPIDEKGDIGEPVISYHAGTDRIVVAGGTTLVDGIKSSMLYRPFSPFNHVENLFAFSLEFPNKTYNSAVYGRAQEEDWHADDPSLDYEDARKVLMEVVASQIGSSGIIFAEPDTTYVKWYSDNYVNWTNGDIEYVEQEAWCGCFVSWALYATNHRDPLDDDNYISYLTTIPQYAGVNYLWLEAFSQTDEDHLKINDNGKKLYHTPQVGDLIFFEYDHEPEKQSSGSLSGGLSIPWKNIQGLRNLTNDDKVLIGNALRYEKNGYLVNKVRHLAGQHSSKDYVLTQKQYKDYIEDLIREDPTLGKVQLAQQTYEPYEVFKHCISLVGNGLDHVGIVIKVEDGYVYTVEGNVSIGNEAAKVMLCKYPLTNEDIFGYATLNWNPAYK